ncbi:hypothetical protein [Bosea sp. 117]|uniref:hypothetical protein n=1 Tax=Bosea sp. 117 TaxID=1125973 RepID=UPI0004942FA1|nr:hypothetical protein [Bosea sp. 117]
MLRVSGITSVSSTMMDEPVPVLRRSPEPLARLMSQHLAVAHPRSDAEALRLLRQAFPAAPLAARVAAMAQRGRTS